MLITIFCLLIIVILWLILYDSNRFVVRQHTFADARIRKNFRAVVVADLHNKQYGKKNEVLLTAIRESKPDMILVAGDIPTARPKARLDIAIDFLRELAEEYPIYYGNGNHEHRLRLYPETYGDMCERYDKALADMGVVRLVNTHVRLPELGVTIYGAEIDKYYYGRFGIRPMSDAYMKSILGAPTQDDYAILIAHNPDYFPQYADWGADLVLAGHIHGGMVRVPIWGKGMVSPNIRLFPKYDGGLFHRGKTTMLLSRGLGMHTIPIRLFNPGEVLVVDFVGENKSSS
ncbi:MAG: metallophosphoesterase [Lachnospiraceae bacterium]|nr:metallophosphoesterase [Lachnospiraceae bacterium]